MLTASCCPYAMVNHFYVRLWKWNRGPVHLDIPVDTFKTLPVKITQSINMQSKSDTTLICNELEENMFCVPVCGFSMCSCVCAEEQHISVQNQRLEAYTCAICTERWNGLWIHSGRRSDRRCLSLSLSLSLSPLSLSLSPLSLSLPLSLRNCTFKLLKIWIILPRHCRPSRVRLLRETQWEKNERGGWERVTAERRSWKQSNRPFSLSCSYFCCSFFFCNIWHW